VTLTRTGWVVVLGTLLVGLTLTYGLFHLLARVYQRPAVQAPKGIERAPTPLPKPVPSGPAAAGPSPVSIAEDSVPTLAWALRGQPEDLERRLEAVGGADILRETYGKGNQYDAVNRTFKLVDHQFKTLLEGDRLYDLSLSVVMYDESDVEELIASGNTVIAHA